MQSAKEFSFNILDPRSLGTASTTTIVSSSLPVWSLVIQINLFLCILSVMKGLRVP